MSCIDRLVLVTADQLRAHRACEIGLRTFGSIARNLKRSSFELQELLDILAANPAEDAEGLSYWYANWLLCTFGGYDRTTHLHAPRDGNIYDAGNLVFPGGCDTSGILVAHNVQVCGDLKADAVILSGRLEVTGNVLTRMRVEASSIAVDGGIESRRSFVAATQGDLVCGGHIEAANEVAADAGSLIVGGDVICGQSCTALLTCIAGAVNVKEPLRDSNAGVVLEQALASVMPIPRLNREARRRLKHAASRLGRSF